MMETWFCQTERYPILVCQTERYPIPPSPTGKTVISCSQLVRVTERQLQLFGSTKVGVLPSTVAAKLGSFAASASTLTNSERKFVVGAAAKLK